MVPNRIMDSRRRLMSADWLAALMGTNAAARAGMGPAVTVVAAGVTTSAGDVFYHQAFDQSQVIVWQAEQLTRGVLVLRPSGAHTVAQARLTPHPTNPRSVEARG